MGTKSSRLWRTVAHQQRIDSDLGTSTIARPRPNSPLGREIRCLSAWHQLAEFLDCRYGRHEADSRVERLDRKRLDAWFRSGSACSASPTVGGPDFTRRPIHANEARGSVC